MTKKSDLAEFDVLSVSVEPDAIAWKKYCKLPRNATDAEKAEAYRLAVADTLIRLYGENN
jgi:hypothetical protein